MLKLQFRDRRKEAVWLVDKSFTIGKNSSNSLMIDDPSVQDFHAEITQNGDELALYDRSAKQTIRVNGQILKGQDKIKVGDVITLGNVELELVDPKSSLGNAATPARDKEGWALTTNASWMAKTHYPIKDKVVIGRDPGCDIHVALDHLSRRHVELEVRSNQLILKDLGSANGTFVNGSKVEEASLQPGDKIKLDVLTFEVSGPAHDPNKTIIRSIPMAKPIVAPSPGKAAPAAPRISADTPTEPKAKVASNGKKLVAEGKQDWLSAQPGTSDSTAGKNHRRTGLMLVIMSGIIAVIATGILIAKYL